ncbi:MAG: DNA repair protein RecN [Clostridiales bacterium]|nr:DNA repair protein RecN [Clostridiales bacterium]
MITTLHIKNVGIIDDLTIELDKGFNVLTGETGAGKTLIIDSINIISGGRFSKEIIRRGEEYSFVELNLFLENDDEFPDGNVVISREVHLNGRNTCKINGRLVTVTELKNFMSNIIDIHGQNDNLKILSKMYQIDYLDNYCGEDLLKLKLDYSEKYSKYLDIKKKLKENLSDNKERERKLDLLQYEFDEIDNANLKIDEENELNEKRNIYLNSEKISTSISQTVDSSDKAMAMIGNAVKAIEKIANIDSKYDKKLEEIRNVYYELEEFSHEINSMNDDMYFDENEINELESRIDLIHTLKRKYGNSIEEILRYKDSIEAEINRINNLDEENEKLKNELEQVIASMNTISLKMHDFRSDISVKLNDRINCELVDLEMKNAKFNAKVKLVDDFNQFGRDDVEFYISPNGGEEENELSKIASGGEMSRIMLAIKNVLADTDDTPVLIFDEIDTGISGKAAKSVGKKLRRIGETHQVICITHQPSIAAVGNSNYFIYKNTIDGRTATAVKKLNKEEVVEEIARISNGEVTNIAKQHALELIMSV